ncbi:MAG: succinyl-diaminopimelate desuccinylase [Gammaproteobacteria bacterium]|jgi:succinyl-diaminopimelate desuccinylase
MIDPVTFSQELIKYPSITPDHAGTIDFLANTLDSLGFKCQKFIFDDPIYNSPVHNLYARLGKTGKNFCFAGHTDVVPVGDLAAWSVDPFAGTIIKDHLYGRGTTDMKCAIACFVSAVKSFITQHQKTFNGSISFLITGDEEGHALNGTPKVLQILKEQKEIIDHCLVGEPSNANFLGEMIKIGRRGSLNSTLEIHGKQGHVASPYNAHNPIKDLVKAYNALLEQPLDQGNEHFQPSNLEFTSVDVGNKTCNIIPNKAYAKFNVRFNNNYTPETLINTIKDRLDLTKINYDLKTEVGGECFINHPQQFCELVTKAIQETINITPKLETSGGTSDARFIKNLCPVLEFGLICQTAHQIDERVSVKDLYNLTKIYEKILEYYFSY